MRRLLLPALATLCLTAIPATAQDDVPTFQEANAALQAGEFDDAAEMFQERMAADPEDGQAHFLYAYCLHAAGKLDAAHDAHLDAARFPQFTAIALYNHACVHALKGQHDAAFHALDEAMDAGFHNADQLEGDADWAKMRTDGRFREALMRMRGVDLTKLSDLPAEHRFDFYVGDWSMWNGDQVEKTLSVQSDLDGHGITVVSKDPRTGEVQARSVFVFDPAKGSWRQVWISREGMILTLEGGLSDDALVLEVTSQNGAPASGARSVFSDISADGFTYRWQESKDGGTSWETVATRTFTRN